jgi:hypothetical protein
MLSIPNQLEGAYVGQDVMLECHTEAYPASINYWTTERGDMIISGEKMVDNLCEIDVCEINCEFSCLKLLKFSTFYRQTPHEPVINLKQSLPTMDTVNI